MLQLHDTGVHCQVLGELSACSSFPSAQALTHCAVPVPPLLLLPLSPAQCRVGDVVRATTAFTMQMTYPAMQLMFGGEAGRHTADSRQPSSMLPLACRSSVNVCDMHKRQVATSRVSLHSLGGFDSIHC
jgi:hypothetical protein